MKSLCTIAIVSFVIISCNPKQTADTLYINGEIHTVNDANDIEEAVAVKEGVVLLTGSTEEAMELAGENTEIIDLEGRLMTPGLIEGHGHFMGMGYNMMFLDLLHITSYEEMIEEVQKAIAEAGPGEWILGRGWHQSKWEESDIEMIKGFPTHDLLSAASPDNPVFLRHASGHAAIANTKAMEIAGITTETQFETGGEIIKDKNGNPTGIFNERAIGLVGRVVPENDVKSDIEAFKLAELNCLEHGITSFHDAGAGRDMIRMYKDILENDGYKVRLYVMLAGSDDSLLDDHFSKGPEIGLGENFLTIRSVKLFADGALGSRGAWLIEPYADMAGHYGHAVAEMSKIYESSSKAIQAGFQVCTHAIGDRANSEILDIYEKVYLENSESTDPRFRIEHAQHLSLSDIPRFKELGVIPAMQAIHMSSDRPWAIDRLGKQRIEEGAYVWQKLLKTGVKIVNGTDVPVEPISPINCFYASVTRKTLQGSPPEGYEPDQKMTREQALRSYTLDAAYGAFEEEMKGSIEPGKMADFTVFSDNIMTIPEEEILTAEIDMTIVNGEILFNRD